MTIRLERNSIRGISPIDDDANRWKKIDIDEERGPRKFNVRGVDLGSIAHEVNGENCADDSTYRIENCSRCLSALAVNDDSPMNSTSLPLRCGIWYKFKTFEWKKDRLKKFVGRLKIEHRRRFRLWTTIKQCVEQWNYRDGDWRVTGQIGCSDWPAKVTGGVDFIQEGEWASVFVDNEVHVLHWQCAKDFGTGAFEMEMCIQRN